MYELLVLSLLMHWPLHAYRIAKIANDIIGPEDQISTGTLSTLLSKLARTGLISTADPGITPFASDRLSRVFALTSAGRERFFALMLDTTSHPGNYRRIFHIKSLHLELLPPESQIFLVEHYIACCQQFLRSKRADEQDMSDHPLKQKYMQSVFRERALALIQLKIEEWQIELAWVQSLRAQTLSRLKQSGETGSEDKKE